MLTASQALALMTVTWFVRLNRKKGNDWASLTATQVSEFLAEKFDADVGPKAAQNALRSLTVQGYLRREDHKVSGFSTVYRYSLVRKDAEVPVVFLDREAQVLERVPNSPPLSNSLKNQNDLRETPRVMEPSRAPAPAASDYRSTGMSSSLTRIEGIPSSRSLSQIKELCERLGNGELPLPNEVPQDYVDALNKKRKPQC